jgi:hypothetical protein
MPRSAAGFIDDHLLGESGAMNQSKDRDRQDLVATSTVIPDMIDIRFGP